MVSNRNYFGHLVMPDDFDTSRINPEMWQIFNNPLVSVNFVEVKLAFRLVR